MQEKTMNDILEKQYHNCKDRAKEKKKKQFKEQFKEQLSTRSYCNMMEINKLKSPTVS